VNERVQLGPVGAPNLVGEPRHGVRVGEVAGVARRRPTVLSQRSDPRIDRFTATVDYHDVRAVAGELASDDFAQLPFASDAGENDSVA
jgi:hypothetical protein